MTKPKKKNKPRRVAVKDSKAPAKPTWDAPDHTLSWNGVVVHRFREDAPSQEVILTALEAAGWSLCISFAPAAGAQIESKAELRYAVQNLNRSCRRTCASARKAAAVASPGNRISSDLLGERRE